MAAKVIVLDGGVLAHKAIFAWGAQARAADGGDTSHIISATYTYFRMILNVLKKIGINREDTIIMALDARHSWRRAFYPCFDKKTEVLTDEGWLYLKDIVENKKKCKVATLNQRKNIVEYQDIKNYISYNYTGDMYKFGGNKCSIDLFITENHKHLSKKPHEKEFKLIEAKNISFNPTDHYKEFNYKGKKKKYFILPKYESNSIKKQGRAIFSYKVEIPERKILMNDWLTFLGYYLSEGCLGGKRYSGHVKKQTYNSKNVYYNVVISQSHFINPEKCKEIETNLKKLDSKY